MQIQVNTDHHIPGHEELVTQVEETVIKALHRFGPQITRVEVHLSDNNGHKSDDGETRCMMEARVTGYQPVAVSAHAATLHQAISAAADKLKRAIDSTLGRLHDKRHPAPVIADEAVADEEETNER